MIVSRPIQDAMRGVGRNALDLPVAGLAALAALFVAFALPADLLADLIAASGLPSVLPAAQPPLGLTARIAIGAVGAGATFGLILLLLRLLDRSGLEPRRARAAEPQDETPKLRRRDFHPDAPVPRPISAARDLGEPAPPARPGDKTPLWLAEPAPEAPVEAAAPEPALEPEPAPVEIEPAPVADSAASLAELMERLERGLAGRRAATAAPAASDPPQVFPEAGEDRLQSAIDSLHRLAARQS
ncbi:MAG TPA: hypothetical protein VEW71_04025 [Allosphingosinicella sp.]|nr:hypothetical protein [Allosphingosinicella sp.]